MRNIQYRIVYNAKKNCNNTQHTYENITFKALYNNIYLKNILVTINKHI